jgi:NTP pyrophosphatase (non-canonical NTP hydrolase)
MDINEAQKRVDELIQKYGGYWEPLSMLARLTEEVGELSRVMNIKYGGKKAKSSDDGRSIEKELADVIFTALAIANVEEIDLGKVLEDKIFEDDKKCSGVYK